MTPIERSGTIMSMKLDALLAQSKDSGENGLVEIIYEGGILYGKVTDYEPGDDMFGFAPNQINLSQDDPDFTLYVARSKIYTIRFVGDVEEIPTPEDTREWREGVSHLAGDVVSFNGESYSCIQGHTSLAGWTPAAVPALWKKL